MRLLFAIILVLMALLIVAFILLVRPALADWGGCRRCAMTGARALSTDNRTLERGDTTITESPKKTCTGQLNPRIKQVEVRCH
jgi:hypothetical protein